MPEIRVLLAADAALALPALRELRPASPQMASAQALRAHLAEVEGQGYRLAGSFEPGREEAAAVAGYRVLTNLAWGRFLYLDDLSTLPDARGRGHASALLGWLEAEARRLGCAQLHLDSGVGPARFTAHRLYLGRGLNLTSHHFAKELT
ncbi:Acetyltransferase (GNAT) domain-containing protein [Deinococcus reticulitermitis]|uniref:Acetyltransferase (GNAT) domain-containing protein n=1 Tax=Deinococcus reticulitermitis TaxID=856736 RepID=A0A1H6W226_9DEIO|nr:GNAT family N-acetyltransferase [Deinococcus reticulitermitis]SEJ10988.1 Acetyltransferase (GNAT) domain-containing protein [Deinococcus reticulitermitis]